MEVIARGTGPGPKNVLVLKDGKKIVYTYREWRKLMAEGKWVTMTGIVQFDPEQKTVNNKEITEFTMRLATPAQTKVKVSVWPNFLLNKEVEKGDFIAVDGKLTQNQAERNGELVVYNNLSPTNLIVNGTKVAQTPRETVGTSGPSSDEPEAF